MTKDIIVRQYAHLESYIDAILANTGSVTGIQLMMRDSPLSKQQIDQFIEVSDRIKFAGLDVIPGCHLLPYGDYANPEMWKRAAKIVKAIGPSGNRDLFAFDSESYAPRSRQRVTLGRMNNIQRPLVKVLNDHDMGVAWYPAHENDIAMIALLGEVGGEAWLKKTLGKSANEIHDFKKLREQKIDTCYTTDMIEDILPDVVFRPGFYDRAIREGIHKNNYVLPTRSWIFDSSRGPSIISGVGDERNVWGTSDWHTGESLSTLNTGVQNVFQFQRLNMETSPEDFKNDILMTLKWNNQAAGYGANDPNQVRAHPEGLEYKGLWHAAPTPTGMIQTLDECTIAFVVKLPENVSGSFPLANVWYPHGCCRCWSVSIQEGNIRLTIGMGTRTPPDSGASGYRFHDEIDIDIKPAIAEEVVRIIFGYDANTVYLPDRAPIVLPDGKETNNIRANISIGQASQIMHGSSELDHYSRETTIWKEQLVRWNRVLTSAEMNEYMRGGQYPWGL